jgi:hypothetical protein
MNKSNSTQVVGHKSDKNPTIQVRIDRQWHDITKQYGKKARRTLRSLLEEGLSYVIPQNFTIDNSLDHRPEKDP